MVDAYKIRETLPLTVCSFVSMDMHLIYNYKIILVGMAVLNVLYLVFEAYKGNGSSLDIATNVLDTRKYIIDTPGCRIEDLNPFSNEIKDYVYKIKKLSCRNRGLLTYVTRTDNAVTLNINSSLLHDYSAFKIDCCYSIIKRNTTGPKPDDNLSFSDCIHFNDSVTVNENFVKVECSNFLHKVYENIHATLQPPKWVVSNKDDPSVILVGIDGVSRSNFIRSMPRTFEFCERNSWINLGGYNKIADNTYPNLMAVLTGMNYSQAVNSCDPYKISALNNCEHFIWNKYRKRNYSTAYAEDTPRIATFNGIKAGFIDPPTDYYFRPYFLAADDLSTKYLCLKAHCTGPEKTGIRMQVLIKDFISAIKDSTPGFGLFWMNSFSHEDVNCPSSMDDDFVEFFEELESGGYLDNTIVIFLSDHGFRFGRIRLTHTGWMEERLPFIYIWIPHRFRMNHAVQYTNLVKNSNKLTTPYDIYMTLQHILALSNKTFIESPSQGCPQCQSLLKPMDSTRTCVSSGVPQHFCTCSTYEKINKDSARLKEIADFFVEEINKIVRSYGNASRGCSRYFLDRISHAKSLIVKQDVEENILIGVVTNPEAIFEATIRIIYGRDQTDKTMTLMETSRLDRYAPKTFCVQNSPVQMYCYCIEWQNCTRPHEVYKCGSACQTECATLGEICPIVNIRCNDSCYCVDGYARDTDGVCIKIANCPPKSK